MAESFLLVVTPTGTELRSAAGEALAAAPVEDVARRVEDLSWRLGQARRGGSSAEVVHRLRLLGEAIGEAFCAGPVAAELGRLLAGGDPVRLGVRADDPRLRDLPWEACILPGRDEPLSLERGVDLYRAVDAGPAESRAPRAPLRVLAVLAAPWDGRPLDLDGEVERIQAALGAPARRADCHVEVISPGTIDGLRGALAAGPAHVVHLACHGMPGAAVLEDRDGNAVRVGAEELAAELRGTPLVVLAGCHTAVGDEDLPGIAHGLVSSGTPAVLAMTAQVSDGFSPRLAERFYLGLATAEEPDPLTVLSAARRELEAERLTATADGHGTELVEWATPALFLGGEAGPLYRLADGRDSAVPFAGPVRVPPAGRREEILRIAERCRDGAPVVLFGIEGIGKTRLAEEVVRRLAGHDRPVVRLDGRIEVADLRDVDDHAVLWCDGFEPNVVRAGHGLHEIADRALARRLAELPATTIFTCRHPFFPAEGQAWRLTQYQPILLIESAIIMMFFRLPALNALRPGDRETVATEIGGHPYALERLNDLIATGGGLRASLDACVAEMSAHCRLPEFLAGLDPVARRMFLHVAVHRLLLRQRAALLRPADAPPEDSERALSDLALAGLVIHQASAPNGEPLLLVPRWVAAALEPLADAEELREAHRAAAYIYEDSLAQFREARYDDWATEAELLREARHHHLQAGDVLYANSSANQLSRIWSARGRWHELTRLHEEQLTLAEPDGPDAGAAHQSLAQVALERGDTAVAAGHARAALGIFGNLGARVRAAEALHALAAIDQKLGDDAAAAARCRTVLAMVAGENVPHLVAACNMVLGNGAARRGEPGWERFYDEAVADLRRSDRADASDMISLVHTNRATALALLGRHEAATAALREAMDAYGDVGGGVYLARVLHDMALIAQAQRDYPGAQRYLREAVRIREAAGDREGSGSHYHELGILAMERDDLDGAEAYYRRALLTAREAGDRAAEGVAYHELALVARKRGDLDRARKLASRSITMKIETGSRPELASSYTVLGQILQAQGEPEEALAPMETGAGLSREIGNPEDIVLAHGALGGLLLELGRADDAAAALGQAVAAGRTRNLPGPLARDLGRLAHLRFEQGDPAAAETLYREMLEVAAAHMDRAQEGQAHNQLGVIALQAGRCPDATGHFTAALEATEELGDDYNVAGSLRNLGNVALLGDDLDTALDRFGRAQEIFRSLGRDEEADWGHRELATTHIARGDADAAFDELVRFTEARHAAGDPDGKIDGMLELADLQLAHGAAADAVQVIFVALVEALARQSSHTFRAIELLARYRRSARDEEFRGALTELGGPDAVTLAETALERYDAEHAG